MRAAGVRTESSRLIWVEASDHDLKPLDRVLIRLEEGDVIAVVYVTPEQLLRPPELLQGQILRIYEPDPASECWDIPGADLPPLGSEFGTPDGPGTVVQIDVLQRRVAIRASNSEEFRWVEVPGDVLGKSNH